MGSECSFIGQYVDAAQMRLRGCVLERKKGFKAFLPWSVKVSSDIPAVFRSYCALGNALRWGVECIHVCLALPRVFLSLRKLER